MRNFDAKYVQKGFSIFFHWKTVSNEFDRKEHISIPGKICWKSKLILAFISAFIANVYSACCDRKNDRSTHTIRFFCHGYSNQRIIVHDMIHGALAAEQLLKYLTTNCLCKMDRQHEKKPFSFLPSCQFSFESRNFGLYQSFFFHLPRIVSIHTLPAMVQ